MREAKKIAAIITEYRRNSHADVIVGKILEGYNYDGKERPDLQVVSMYVDQFPKNDMSRDLARKHNFKIYDSIPAALTLGGPTLAVDGVMCIGEHGNYPFNEKGQHLYPRRRFFEEVMNTFARTGKSVPVFNDKHLSASWADAKWMYDKARELFVPFLAGSSIPLAWRRPPLQLPRNCELIEAVQIGYSGLESYGFHALEGLQCMAERRKGGETGVKAVRCVQGEEMWRIFDEGRWPRELLEAAQERVPAHADGDYRALTAKEKNAAIYFIEYIDGFRAAVAMMNGWARGGGGFSFAGKLKGQEKPAATLFYLQPSAPFAHMGLLAKAFEATVHSNHAVYPVERTLLTTGILDAVMTSRADKGRRIETPHLAIRYQPTDWPFATEPMPKAIER